MIDLSLVVDSLLENWPKPIPRVKKIKEESKTSHVSRPRKSRKLTPEVIKTLKENRGLSMKSLLRLVLERHQITLTEGSVYKAWKME